MTEFETLDQLPDFMRDATIDLLQRLGDDDLIIGHRNSEWTGLAPILEEDIAFSSMAQDEIGHAQAYYQLIHELGGPDPDALAFGRGWRDYRCASFVSLTNDRDWGFCVLRQFLYDMAETVRLTALEHSALVPLAQLARKLRGEEKYHLMHGRTWVLRLGDANDDAHQRMQQALSKAYPHALGLFEPTSADETLAQGGICPREVDLRSEWESAVVPVLGDAGLEISENVQPVHGGRMGRHPEALKELLESMQLVHNIDPTAKW